MTPIIHFFPTLPSTMDEARRMAEEGAAEGTVVQAGSQSAGRGRFGNQWSSPEGNLYMTLILRPQKTVKEWAQLSFVMAVSLANALEGHAVPKSSINLKWPNDVLLDGKKIAGILLEMQNSNYLLVGIGVNIAKAPEGAATLQNIPRDPFRDHLLQAIKTVYEEWQNKGFMPIREHWLEYAYGIGKPIIARMANRSETGIFQGIDSEGNLLMKRDDGTQQLINSGAVHFDDC